ncbi:hypothetical protein V3C99_011740 [Haemonchus contortus]
MRLLVLPLPELPEVFYPFLLLLPTIFLCCYLIYCFCWYFFRSDEPQGQLVLVTPVVTPSYSTPTAVPMYSYSNTAVPMIPPGNFEQGSIGTDENARKSSRSPQSSRSRSKERTDPKDTDQLKPGTAIPAMTSVIA